ncbi:MAG: response regulator [Desulfobulbaceae bacterium]|nr:response regulator [Desulfobulbaceae bacterium]
MRNEIVLVVDDDPEHLSLVERYVSSFGLQCKSAGSGFEAIENLKTENISLVVTDMVMPGMDGMELLKKIKRHHPHIDVIVMTGYSEQYSYIDVIQAGATDFIAKPFKRDEFSAKLDRAFRERDLLSELRESKEKAEAASRTKTDFLCTISHELKTPMNGILGFTWLLSNADLPPKEMEYVQLLGQSSNRLMKLINQILDFSALEARTSSTKPHHFHLKDVFEEIFVAAQPRAEAKGLLLHHEIDEFLLERVLFGDQFALQQILYNLTDNAIKFADSGQIDITVKKSMVLSGDTVELQFSIKDQGCGIHKEKQDAIFEPFTQAEGYMTRKHEGAGLGLAICAKLVDMMNGEIWLESRVGEGSVFYFSAQMHMA